MHRAEAEVVEDKMELVMRTKENSRTSVCQFRSLASSRLLPCGCGCSECRCFTCHSEKTPLNKECVPYESDKLKSFIDSGEVLNCSTCHFYESATQRTKWPFTVEAAIEEINGPLMHRGKEWAEATIIQWAHKQLLDEAAAKEYPIPDNLSGRGIVIPASGELYFNCAYVSAFMLRSLRCNLPIQFWYWPNELTEYQIKTAEKLGVECVCTSTVKIQPRIKGGWELKPFAIINSSFSEVIMMDADNLPVVDPTFLFDDPRYKEVGTVFWPDVMSNEGSITPEAWAVANISESKDLIESGFLLLDKSKCWKELQVVQHMNNHSDFWYNMMYGDQNTFLFSWLKTGKKYLMAPPSRYVGVCYQELDLDGNDLSNHACHGKNEIQNGSVVSGMINKQLAISGAKHRMSNVQKKVELTNKKQNIEHQCKQSAQSMSLSYNTTICRVLGDQILFVPSNDLSVASTLCQTGCWEPDITRFISRLVRNDWNCLDIGANCGYYTALLSKLCPSGEIESFEPNKKLAEMLVESKIHNNWSNVNFHFMAVGDEDKLVSLSVPPVRWGDATVIEGNDIQQFALDDLGIKRPINFIKIDVEGSEQAIWHGMKELRKQNGLHIVMEIEKSRYKDAEAFYREIAGEFPLMRVDSEGDAVSCTIEELMLTNGLVMLYLNRGS